MKLINVYRAPNAALYLYALLAEREEHVNISHRKMPTPAEHLAFMKSRPYRAWYLIEDKAKIVGAIYLTRRREIGVFILRAYRGMGYGHRAIRALRTTHSGQLFANVNPTNRDSRKFFEKIGAELVQITYKLAASTH